MNPDLVLRRRRDVRYRRIEDEAVVLVQDAGEVLVLNEVGARTLDLLDGERSLRAVLDVLQAEFAVARPELEDDVLRFTEELRTAGVVEVVG